MSTNEEKRTDATPFLKKHWIASWFGIGLISYVAIAMTIYWLLMHGFSIFQNGSYDRATSVAIIIQATLAAAGLLAVSAALLAIARNTDRTYKQQLEQQKWQRREEFTQFAENVLQKGLETYVEICHGILQQIGNNAEHVKFLKNDNPSEQREDLQRKQLVDSLDCYLAQIKMHEWDAIAREQIKTLYSDFYARAIAHSPFWNPVYSPKDVEWLNLEMDAESAAVPLCALTACGAFSTMNTKSAQTWIGEKEIPEIKEILKSCGNPLIPWLHTSYSARYVNDKEFKATSFPALLALVDMMPSLLNVVAYLEQYHLADANDHSDSKGDRHERCKHQLVRFEQYLRIPSLKPLCQVHGITKAQGLRNHLSQELRARGQVTAVKSNGNSVSTYQLSETREKELGFWFGPFEVFFSKLYNDIVNRSTPNNKQDAVTAKSSYDDWFNSTSREVDKIAYFYRYGLSTVEENLGIREEIIKLEENHVIEKYKDRLSRELPPDQFQLAMKNFDGILKRAKAGEVEAVAQWNQIKNDLNDL